MEANEFIEELVSHFPGARKRATKGWQKFNAPCCVHRGTTPDTKRRGNIKYDHCSIGYYCFNCGYAAVYTAGKPFTKKLADILLWCKVSFTDIQELKIKSWSVQMPLGEPGDNPITPEDLKRFQLPKDSKTLVSWAGDDERALGALEYLMSRNPELPAYFDFYWSPEVADRVIIPVTQYGMVIGYITRSIEPKASLRYIKMLPSDALFGFDNLYGRSQRKFCIICEGPLDSISVMGCSTLGFNATKLQRRLIKESELIPILLPDRDKDGLKLIEIAKEEGWHVSMPNWPHKDTKDAADAVAKYGRIYTVKAIIENATQSDLKIDLQKRFWIKDV